MTRHGNSKVFDNASWKGYIQVSWGLCEVKPFTTFPVQDTHLHETSILFFPDYFSVQWPTYNAGSPIKI